MEKSIDEDRWDKKLVNKTKKFLTVDVRKYVSLSKVQDKEK